MKIAYLDCQSGISGDMTLAALVDAGVDLAEVQRGIDSLGLPSCRLATSEVKRRGFRATHLAVEHEPEHAHRHLHHITRMIDGSTLSDRQQDLARRIFTRLAEAEAKVHGTTIQKVHFHEVGAVDSIADVVGAAIAWDLLGVERVLASPVPTGRGFIEIAHGRCSVPAPAVAELLRGVPIAPSEIEAELTTPTGAAILSVLVDGYGPLPAMRIERIGYGAGTRDLAEQPNILRLLVGRADEAAAQAESDQVAVLETNLDDATGEQIGHAMERLLAAGALDVYTTAIGMKKNRPGVKLTVLCRPEDAEPLEIMLLAETTTLGVRRWMGHRRKLERREHVVETPLGPVEGKLARLPDGSLRFSPEYEACRRVAAERGVPLRAVQEAALAAYEASR
jgi:pyridinium-3,5-bisthiocarboxylic acid mononucleotide nickel chelatase